ncbi:E3 ubiquitin-protein ligase RNF14-like isoform X2 [Ptychodera flava]
MASSDKEEQEDEILALASIYEDDDIFIAGEDNTGGQFNAKLQTPDTFYLQVKGPLPAQLVTKGVKTVETEDGHTLYPVQYLPPIVLNFQYPPDYPSCSAPQYTLSCKWLSVSELSKLCAKLDEIWEENKGGVVLFSWTQFLSEEAIDFLQIKSPLKLTSVGNKKGNRQSEDARTSHGDRQEQNDDTTDKEELKDIDSRAVQDIASPSLLLITLVDYNKQEQQRVFNSSYFTCNVCFSEKRGADCINFIDCSHVYCKDCMKGYFEVQINEGNVKCLTCPDTDCESQAIPSQVYDLVGKELFARYDRLLLQSSLDRMADVVYCPRKNCECAVMKEKDSNMGVCPACQYAFCTFCKLAYHGLSPCKLKKDELAELRKEYEEGDEQKRRFLEKRYGKNVLKQALEESYSEQWLSSHSKECPNCGTHIQKIDGCNKMTCVKCRAYFCWLCLAMLSRGNPYTHFNTPGSECFNQLFQGMENFDGDGDDEDDDDDAWQPQWWFI